MADFDVKVVNEVLVGVPQGKELRVDAHISAIDRVTFNAQLAAQEWEYRFILIPPPPHEPLLQQLNEAGALHWEAVCVIGNSVLLKKSKVAVG